MNQDHKDFLSAFHAHDVRYLIVGGYVVILHAQPRFTENIDFFIRPDLANARATYAALAEFGAALQGIRPEDFTDRNSFFRFGRDPRGIDILPDIPGVDFDAAWEQRVETVIDPASGLKPASILVTTATRWVPSHDDAAAPGPRPGRPEGVAHQAREANLLRSGKRAKVLLFEVG